MRSLAMLMVVEEVADLMEVMEEELVETVVVETVTKRALLLVNQD